MVSVSGDDAVSLQYKRSERRRPSLTKRILSFCMLLAMASNWESWLNRTTDMGVVRLPIAFKGLGRSLFLHEDAPVPYTLTIPDFDLENNVSATDG
jgi:rRNA maturation protein Rpf1